MAALAWVMPVVLFGSHWTVTFLCAVSYCLVSCCSPALSAAVIGPVFGGSTALIATEAPVPELPEVAELLEQPAARTPAASRVAPADSTERTWVLRNMNLTSRRELDQFVRGRRARITTRVKMSSATKSRVPIAMP